MFLLAWLTSPTLKTEAAGSCEMLDLSTKLRDVTFCKTAILIFHYDYEDLKSHLGNPDCVISSEYVCEATYG
jgi:hypothetical protein